MFWTSHLSLSVLTIISIVYLIQSVQSATLVLYHTVDNTTVVPIEEPDALVPLLNLNFLTMFYATGFKGSVEGPESIAIMSSYISCGNYNVILTNWTEEVSNPYPTDAQGYFAYALQNAIKVGTALGLAVVKIVSLGVSAAKVHLIGFSLGAQMIGYAGRKARSEGVIVYRATGLDPAALAFEPPIGYTPINKDSGAFVDCYHTDMGGCGMRTSPCHINFYFNAENFYRLTGSQLQPGCKAGRELCGNLCNHKKVVYYWIEALKFLTNFLAGEASSFLEYMGANGVVTTTTYVGYLCNTTYRGDFYLSTNAESPYGKQEEGLKPSSSSVI